MKKLFYALTISLGVVSSCFANLNGNGFYRVLNYGSSRWGVLIDNYASVDFLAGSADLHSLLLTNNTDEVLSDPGSVVYISKKSNNQYDVAAQGVTLESLVNNNISIRANGTGNNNQEVYMMYGTYKGATKYIGDANIITSQEYGKASINVTNTDFNKWYIIPMDVNSDNYFGTVPSVTAENGLYTTLFTSFAYKPFSENVTAYYIGRVGYGMAEMVEITDAVPPGSPVVIKCAGEKVSDNKLQILEQQTTLPANALTGVYFNYSGSTNVNKVKYDPATMRILGVCSDGSIGFVTGEIESIPANTAYLKVPEGSAPEIKCVSSQEYEQNLPEAPENFTFGKEDYALYPQGDDDYSGTFDIPAPQNGETDVKLRFYASSATKADDSFIGAYGSDVKITEGASSLPFQYGSPYYWILSNWKGGTLQVTINLQYQYVKFYSETAGINTVLTDNTVISYDGNTIRCEGGQGIKIYDMAGRLVSSSKENSINVSSLAKGTYVVVAGGISQKFQL